MCPLSRQRFRSRLRIGWLSSPGGEQIEVIECKDRVDRPIANVVDAIEVGAKLLDVGAEPRQIAERLIEIGEQRLKRHQNADAQAAENDFLTAQAEDRDRGQAGEGRGEGQQESIPEPEDLLGADHAGLIAAPADEQVGFGTGGLDAFDHLDRPHDAGQEPPADLLDRPIAIGPPAAKPLDGDQVQTADPDADGGQRGSRGSITAT